MPVKEYDAQKINIFINEVLGIFRIVIDLDTDSNRSFFVKKIIEFGRLFCNKYNLSIDQIRFDPITKKTYTEDWCPREIVKLYRNNSYEDLVKKEIEASLLILKDLKNKTNGNLEYNYTLKRLVCDSILLDKQVIEPIYAQADTISSSEAIDVYFKNAKSWNEISQDNKENPTVEQLVRIINDNQQESSFRMKFHNKRRLVKEVKTYVCDVLFCPLNKWINVKKQQFEDTIASKVDVEIFIEAVDPFLQEEIKNITGFLQASFDALKVICWPCRSLFY